MAFLKANQGSEIFYSFANSNQTLFPIGYIYISADPTNPGTYFGGTWVLITDRVLIGAGSSYAAGTYGGSSSVTLRPSNIPSHTHSFSGSGSFSGNTGSGGSHSHRISYTTGFRWDTTNSAGKKTLLDPSDDERLDYVSPPYTDSAGSHCHSFSGSISISGTTGGSGSASPSAFSIIQPYYAVYMWQRTA